MVINRDKHNKFIVESFKPVQIQDSTLDNNSGTSSNLSLSSTQGSNNLSSGSTTIIYQGGMTWALELKLEGIEEGALVNLNAFSFITIDDNGVTNLLSADLLTDNFTIKSSTPIKLTLVDDVILIDYIWPEPILNLNELLDVDSTNLINEGILKFNTTTSKWEIVDGSDLATRTWVLTQLEPYATQLYVINKIDELIGAAPGALDTLEELALALGDDPNFATTITNLIAGVDDRVDTVEASITTIQGNITTILNSISTINTNISNIEDDISDINTSITNIGADIDSIDKDILTINSTIDTLPTFDDITWGNLIDKPIWIDSTKPTYQWSEIENKPSWIGSTKPTYNWSEINNKPTTLAGFGITDGVNTVNIAGSGNVLSTASVSGHTLTLTKGITALTSHLAIYQLTLQVNGVNIGTFNPKTADATINVTVDDLGAITTVNLASITDLHSSWYTVLDTLKPNWITQATADGRYALNFLTSGTGNALTGFTKTGNTITFTKDTFVTPSNLTAYATTASVNSALSGKVDKVDGKGLSSNDFTDALLSKLNGIAAGANNYVLPTATASVLGGVKVGTTLAIASGVLNLKAVGTAGTYTKVTTNAYGQVTSGTTLAASDIPNLSWSKITSGKPTTLSGYGITDAVTLTTAQTISGAKTFANHIYMGTAHYIYGINETGGAILFHDGTRTIIGSFGESNTAATHIRSITGHATISNSNSATYTILDTGNYTSTLDTRYLLKSTYTASDILTKLKTVDGSGSGLDADTLDGKQGTDYLADRGALNDPADWDSYINPSYYTVFTNSDGYTGNNYPSGAYNYGGLMTLGDSTCKIQIYIPHFNTSQGISKTEVRIRNTYSTVWSDWRNLAFIDSNVASASKLATARTINGTSFDGSANIVTSYWGTARTLTLSSYLSGSVSINGSANVTLSANVLGLTSQGNKTAISGSTVPESGLRMYQVYKNGYPCNFGNLISVKGLGAGELLLEWVGSSAIGHLYYRSQRDMSETGWSDWGKIAFTSDLTVSNLTDLHSSWDSLLKASKPTMLSGYGITDAYTKTEGDGRYMYHYRSTALNADSFNQTSPRIHEISSGTNMPTSNEWHQIMTWGTGDSKYIFQLANTYVTSGSMYFRQMVSGSWGAWKKILDTTNYTSTLDSRYLRTVSLATITDLHSSWDAVLKAQKPAWLTTVSLATISDLHASWDALLKAAPSVYVTRWPTAAEVGALTQATADGRYLLKSSYTAADVLAKLKTVDGSGSGLDADLLDGLDSLAFARAKTGSHGSSSTTYTPKTYVNNFANAGYFIADRGTWDYAGNGYISTDWGNIHLAGTAVATWNYGNVSFTQLYITAPQSYGDSNPLLNEMLFYSYNTADYPSVWTRVLTNRNYASVLNDKYVTLDTEQTISGRKTFTGAIHMGTNHFIYGVNEGGGGMLFFDGTRTVIGSYGATNTAATHIRSKTGHATIGASNTASYNILDTGNYTSYLDSRYVNVSGDTMTGPLNVVGYSSSGAFTGAGIVFSNNSGRIGTDIAKNMAIYSGNNIVLRPESETATSSYGLTIAASSLTYNGNNVWHAGNDGSGSGLDADLLDGVHLSMLAANGWTNLATYVYEDSTIYHYCNRIINLNAVGDVILRIRALNDINYPSYSEWVLRANYTTGYGKCVSLTNIGPYHNTLTVYIDESDYVWVRCNIQWNCQFQYKIERNTGSSLLTSVEVAETTPPNVKVYIENQGVIRNGAIYSTLTSGFGADVLYGNLNGNAITATRLATARTLWGQSFNGTGNVSGNMTGVGSISMTGNISGVDAITMSEGSGSRSAQLVPEVLRFIAATGGWASGVYGYNHANTAIVGMIGGVYGTGDTLNYLYYGGTSYSQPAMVILPNKNVGIGTTSPSYKLHVAGTGYFSGALSTASTITANGYIYSNEGWFQNKKTGTGLYNSVVDARWYATSSGWISDKKINANAGLAVTGAATLSSTLSVAGAITASNGIVTDYTAGSYISMATRTNLIYSTTNNSDSSAHALYRVKDSSGNAVVFGGLGNQVGFYGFYASRISANANGTDWATYWNASNGQLLHSKALWVGGAVSFTSTLTVTGAVTGNSTIYAKTGVYSDGYVTALNLSTSSDMRLKTVIRDVNITIENIAKAPSFIFKWNENGLISVGTSAQYWKQILPEAVQEINDYYTLLYGNIAMANSITLARETIKLKALIEKLKRKIKQLEKLIKWS